MRYASLSLPASASFLTTFEADQAPVMRPMLEPMKSWKEESH